MATTNTWATRSIGQPLLDPSGLGRWAGLSFIGKRGKRFAILTAYRSPRQLPKGGFGFFDQQYALLLSKGVKTPNVRRQFITDLCHFINSLQDECYEILLSFDANETLTQVKTYGIGHLMTECSLSDLHLLGPDSPPATYKYGLNRKIDYMLGSPNIADSVRRAGYLAYDDGIFSKHRGLFVDIDFLQLMGPLATIVPAPARRLRSEDQFSVDKYVEAFKQYATDHNIWDRVSDLATVASTLTTSQCRSSYDAIDRDITRAMLHAEKLAKRTSALQTRLSSLHFNLTDDQSSDADTVRLRWKSALKQLREVRATAHDHRTIHLKTTLTQYENMEQSTEVKEKIRRIHRLLNIESMRKPFRNIHSALSSTNVSGLSKLFVPSGIKDKKVAARFIQSDGTFAPDHLIDMAKSDKTSVTYDTILDCDTIERELLSYNRKWFRQAKDTPFGHGELYDLLGYDGLTEEATSIVSGTCISHLGIPMSRELQVFLEECKRPSTTKEISSFINIADFTKTVKDWKETTSTSPSGRHLGHYKTALLDERLTALHVAMINIPIRNGFAPERWTHSVTPLIEKDAGKPYLTRLRVIHLFEADYNLFLKLIYGKRLVRNAELSNALNDQQHGSRPRRMTTDALFLARLEKDLIRQTKSNSAHMDNDATGCYDRIVTSVGMVACQRLGMTKHATRCQADTLRRMKYSVKHAYGVSDSHYTSTENEPLFGTGQGSGASPAIWLGVVVILLNALDRISKEDNIKGLTFSDPWQDLLEEWRVGAFVDDTNQGVMDPQGLMTPEILVDQLRQAGQTWEQLLHISGGSLNLAKCSWTLQYWQWINGRPSLRPFSASDPPLLLNSGESPEHHIIHQHTNSTELKGLGVYMNFNGTFEVHARKMKEKFDALASRLRQSHLTPALSRLFYASFYTPSVKYSIPVTSMTAPLLHKVQSRMTAAILNKLGYNRHYPHSVAFAPTKVFGCGLLDLRLEQGLSHIQSLLDYVGTNHKIGRVMLISLRHLQVEAGVSFDLLRQANVELPYLTECWIVTLRRFCAEHNVSIRCQHNRVPIAARQHDLFLMEKAILLNLRRQEIIDINLVRSFLQVTTLSDIATADGHFIVPSIWNGCRISDRQSTMQFARQVPPTSYQRGLWRRLLRSFLDPTSKTSDLCLLQPLGSWIRPSNMVWGAMTWEDSLYRRDPHSHSGDRNVAVHYPQHLVRLDGSPASGIFYDSIPDWYTASIPRMAVPTDLIGDQIFIATHSDVQYTSVPAPATSFAAWVAQLPPAEHRLISSVFFATSDAEQALVQYLQLECPIFIGTDGGKRIASGSFAWVICSPGREKLVLNAGPVDGWYKCQTSLRSEAAALASVTLYLDELSTFFDIQLKCQFVLYVDSNSAITNVQNLRDLIPKRRYANNADILSTMADAPSILERFTLSHVKSHQDDKTKFEKLPFPAQLNVFCDRMATNQLKRQRTTEHEPEITLTCPLTPRNLPVEVSLRDQVLSSHYVNHIRDDIALNRHRTFLQLKYQWTDQNWADIAWDSFFMCARRTQNSKTATFRSKLVHNWLHLGHRRAKQSATHSPNSMMCPLCQAPEDLTHMLTCPAPRALKIRYDAMAVLRKSIGDFPGFASLLEAIKAWTADPTVRVSILHESEPLAQSIAEALRSQSNIGWLHLFRGFISFDWGWIYPRYDTTSPDDRRKTAVPRLAITIKALQDYSRAIWKGRNEILHEHSAHSLSILHDTLNSEITQMYLLRDSLTDHLGSYFSLPLSDRLKQSPRQRHRWLRLVRLATSHASATGNRQQLISVYFPFVESTGFSATINNHHNMTTSTTVPAPLVQTQPTLRAYYNSTTTRRRDCTTSTSPSLVEPHSPTVQPRPSITPATDHMTSHYYV